MGWVLFFDGDCGFCARCVRWVARADRRARVSFAPLQGKLALAKGLSHHLREDGGTLVVLREDDGRVLTHSDGWIELGRAVGGGWQVFRLARLIPKPWRDAAYRWIARHRHRLPGASASCSLPSADLQSRLRE